MKIAFSHRLEFFVGLGAAFDGLFPSGVIRSERTPMPVE